MAKKMTLKERAKAACRSKYIDVHNYPEDLWLAGHRANRLTRAERAVLDAAETWRMAPIGDASAERKLLDACERLAYKRAKGGAR